MQYIARGHSTSYWVLIEWWAYLEPYQISKIERLGKKIIALTIFTKHSILNLWEGSEYESGFKCINILNIPGLSIYTLIMLNMLESNCVNRNKQSSEYARILNVLDAVHSIRSLYKLRSSYRNRAVFRTLPTNI